MTTGSGEPSCGPSRPGRADWGSAARGPASGRPRGGETPGPLRPGTRGAGQADAATAACGQGTGLARSVAPAGSPWLLEEKQAEGR